MPRKPEPAQPQPQLDMQGPAAQPTKAGSFNAAVADVITALEQIHGLGATPNTLAQVLAEAGRHFGVHLELARSSKAK